MKYYIHITNDTMNTARSLAIDARNVAAAHIAVAAVAVKGDTVRVYPITTNEDGMTRAALMIASVTAKNRVKRTGGNDTQWTMRNELVSLSARVEIAQDIYGDALNVAQYITNGLRKLSPDAGDMYGEAMRGIIDGSDVRQDGQIVHVNGILTGGNIVDSIRAGYAACNRHVHSSRAETSNVCSIEYLEDDDGTVVAINTVIACILSGDDKWIPTDSGTMDKATAKRLGNVLNNAARGLSPVQIAIVKRLALDMTQAAIARDLQKTERTIEKSIANIRAKVADYIAENAPEFMTMIYSARIKASAAKTDARTEEGKARHAEQSKATQAARARAYRARIKAKKAKTGK